MSGRAARPSLPARPSGPDRSGSRRPAEAAVSSVVAAVLLFALFSTAFLTWTVTTAPQWIAENEKEHEDALVRTFADMQSGVERLSVSQSGGAVTGTFPLGAESVRFVQPVPSRGTLSASGTFQVTGSFADAAMHLVDGAVAGAPSEPAGGAPIPDVEAVRVMQLGLSSSITNNGQAWVQVEADDGTNTLTATVEHLGRNSAPTCGSAELRLSIDSPLGSTDAFIACIGTDLGSYTVDLLASGFSFRAGLSQLEAPYTLTFTDGAAGGGATAAGTYLTVYTDPSGFTRLAGDGQPSPSFQLDASADRLVFEPARQEYVHQTLSWEGGAVAVVQGDIGAALALDPDFDLAVAGDTGFLRWTVVDLGVSGSLSGAGDATAVATHLGTTSYLLDATAADFTVTSEAASAWQAFFSDRISAAGTADATVGGGAGTATLSLAQGDVTQWVIQLQVIQVDVRVR